MFRTRQFLLIGAFFILASVVARGDPPAGLTWKDGFPKVTVVGQKMVIEAEAYYVVPKNYKISKIRLQTQVCKAGLPGVADPGVKAVEWDGKLGAGQQPGPLGFYIYCTPEQNMLTAIFDANKTYICSWIVDITDDNNVTTANVLLAPNALAPKPAGNGCDGDSGSDPQSALPPDPDPVSKPPVGSE